MSENLSFHRTNDELKLIIDSFTSFPFSYNYVFFTE